MVILYYNENLQNKQNYIPLRQFIWKGGGIAATTSSFSLNIVIPIACFSL